MKSKRKVGNLLGLAVLGYLVREPMHPYELSRLMLAHGDDRSIKFTHGSVYMVVQQLEKAGLVAAQETTRDGQRPERTVYAITPDGRTELRDWLRDLVGVPRHEFPAFGSALSSSTQGSRSSREARPRPRSPSWRSASPRSPTSATPTSPPTAPAGTSARPPRRSWSGTRSSRPR